MEPSDPSLPTMDRHSRKDTFMSIKGESEREYIEYYCIETVQVNADDDPLDNASPTCGYERCGGFGDFIDMQIDAYGRPWLALSHNPNGDTGIFGTFTNGPTMFGELTSLTVIPEGGPQTL